MGRSEFRRAMRRLGLGLTQDQIEQVLQIVDTDGDGEIGGSAGCLRLKFRPASLFA